MVSRLSTLPASALHSRFLLLLSPSFALQLQAAPASLGMRGDEVRRVRAGVTAVGGGGKSAGLAATAPAAMGSGAIGSGALGTLQGIGSASAATAAAAAAVEASEPVMRKSALPPGRRGPAMTKGKVPDCLSARVRLNLALLALTS